MPQYDISVPGRGTYRVESQTELTDAQAWAAVQNQLAAPPDPSKSGFIPAAKAGWENLKGDVAGLAGRTGLMDVPAAEKYQAERKAAAEKVFTPTQDEWTESPWLKLKETAGGSAPYMAAPLAAGAAATFAGAPALAAAGAAGLASGAQFTATNIGRQQDEGVPLAQTNLLNAALAAAPQAALDMVGLGKIPGVRQLIGMVAKDVGKEAAEKIAGQAFQKTLLDYAKKTGTAMGAEGITEAGQQVFERMQAGLNLTDEKARKEYWDNFVGGAVLGGALAPAGRYIERGQIEGKQRAEDLAAKQAEQQAAREAELAKEGPYSALTVPEVTKPGRPTNLMPQQDLFGAPETPNAPRAQEEVTPLQRQQELAQQIRLLGDTLEEHRARTAEAKSPEDSLVAAAQFSKIQQALTDAQKEHSSIVIESTPDEKLAKAYTAWNKAKEIGDVDAIAKQATRIVELKSVGATPPTEAMTQANIPLKKFTGISETTPEFGQRVIGPEMAAGREEAAAQRQKIADEQAALQRIAAKPVDNVYPEVRKEKQVGAEIAQMEKARINPLKTEQLTIPGTALPLASKVVRGAGTPATKTEAEFKADYAAAKETKNRPAMLAAIEGIRDARDRATNETPEGAATRDLAAVEPANYVRARGQALVQLLQAKPEDVEAARGRLLERLAADIEDATGKQMPQSQRYALAAEANPVLDTLLKSAKQMTDAKKAQAALDAIRNRLAKRERGVTVETSFAREAPEEAAKVQAPDTKTIDMFPEEKKVAEGRAAAERLSNPLHKDLQHVQPQPKTAEELAAQDAADARTRKREEFQNMYDPKGTWAERERVVPSLIRTPAEERRVMPEEQTTALFERRLQRREKTAEEIQSQADREARDAQTRIQEQKTAENLAELPGVRVSHEAYRVALEELEEAPVRVAELLRKGNDETLPKTTRDKAKRQVKALNQRVILASGMLSHDGAKMAAAKSKVEEQLAKVREKVDSKRAAAEEEGLKKSTQQSRRRELSKLVQEERNLNKLNRSLENRAKITPIKTSEDKRAAAEDRAAEKFLEQHLALQDEGTTGKLPARKIGPLVKKVVQAGNVRTGTLETTEERQLPARNKMAQAGALRQVTSKQAVRAAEKDAEAMTRKAAQEELAKLSKVRPARTRAARALEESDYADESAYDEGGFKDFNPEDPFAGEFEASLFSRGVEGHTVDLTPSQINILETGDASAAMQDVANDSGTSKLNKVVAQRLAVLLDATESKVHEDLQDDAGKSVLGRAVSKLIEFSRKGGLTQEVLLHEGTHAAVERVLAMPESQLSPIQLTAKKELQALHAVVARDSSFTSVNAKKSISEFAAEVMSNARLQEQLSAKKWKLSDAWVGFKSVILRLLGVKNPDTMFGAALQSVDALMIPSSVRMRGKETAVSGKLSQKDIAALHDGSNSMQQFAAVFGADIKMKDRTAEDANRVGKKKLEEMNDAPQIAAADAKKLSYSTLMRDGKEYDENNLRHFIEADALILANNTVKHDTTAREDEARTISWQRYNAIRDLIDSMMAEPEFTYVEQALVAKAASTWAVYTDKNGRLALAEIASNNRHLVALVGANDAAHVIAELRAGKPLKEAFLSGIQNNTDANVAKNKASNIQGWKKFPQTKGKWLTSASDKLNAAAAGTSWCTGTSKDMARMQIEGGDFYIHYKDGAPDIAIRMEGKDTVFEVRGNTLNQGLTKEQQPVALAFLARSGFAAGDIYIEEVSRRNTLLALLDGKEDPLDMVALYYAPPTPNEAAAFIKKLLCFPSADGHAAERRISAEVQREARKFMSLAMQKWVPKGYIFGTPLKLDVGTSSRSSMVKGSVAVSTDGTEKNTIELPLDKIKAVTDLTLRAAISSAATLDTRHPVSPVKVVLPNLVYIHDLIMRANNVVLPKVQRIHSLLTTSLGAQTMSVAPDTTIDRLTIDSPSLHIAGGRAVGELVLQSHAAYKAEGSKTRFTLELPDMQYVPTAPEHVDVSAPNKKANKPPTEGDATETETVRYARTPNYTYEENPFARDAEGEAPKKSYKKAFNDTALAAEHNLVDMHATAILAIRLAGEAAPNKHDAQQAEYALRDAAKSNTLVSAAMGIGALEMRTDSKGLREIVATDSDSGADFFKSARGIPVKTDDGKFATLTDYMRAKLGLRIGPEKVGEGHTRESLQAIIDKAKADPKLYDALENAQAKFNAFNNKLVKVVVDSGQFSKEFGDKLLRHQDYVPQYRNRDGKLEMMLGDNQYVSMGDIANTPFLHALKGGKESVLPINESIFYNTKLLLDMAMVNMAKRNMGYVLRDAGAAAKKMQINHTKPPQGKDVLSWKIEPKDKNDTGDRWLRLDTEGTVVAGIPTEMLAQSIEGFHATMPAYLMWAQKANDWLRAGVTRMPTYTLRQLLKDSYSAALVTGMKGGPLLAVARAFKEYGKAMFTNMDSLKEVERRGLVQNNLFTGEHDDMVALSKQMAGGDAPSAVRTILNFLDKSARAADAATRIQIFNDGKARGLSDVEASARTLESMNYHKRGAAASVQHASRALLFFNSGIQALNVSVKALQGKMPFEEEFKVRQNFINQAMLLVVGGFLYTAGMDDDDEYKKLKMTDKIGNLHLPLGEGGYIKLPVAYFEGGGAAWAMGQAIRAMMDESAEDKAIAKAWGKYALQALPGGGGIPMLPGFKQVIEWGTNTDLRTLRSIVPRGQENRTGDQQFSSTTPELYKAMAEITGLSAVKTQHMVSTLIGQSADAALTILDRVAPSGNVEKPALGLEKTPFLSTLFQNPGSSEAVEEMFGDATDAIKAKGSFDDMKREGRPVADMKRYFEQHRTEIAMGPAAQQFTKQIGELNTKIKQVENAPKEAYSGERKTEIIKAMKKRQAELAENYHKAFQRISAAA